MHTTPRYEIRTAIPLYLCFASRHFQASPNQFYQRMHSFYLVYRHTFFKFLDTCNSATVTDSTKYNVHFFKTTTFSFRDQSAKVLRQQNDNIQATQYSQRKRQHTTNIDGRKHEENFISQCCDDVGRHPCHHEVPQPLAGTCKCESKVSCSSWEDVRNVNPW